MTPLLLFFPLASAVSAQQVVYHLIGATDPSVDYEPKTGQFWQSSSNCQPHACAPVPKELTFNHTGIYMNGTHFLPNLDPDDFGGSDPTVKVGWRRRKRSKGNTNSSGGGGSGRPPNAGGHDDPSAAVAPAVPAASTSPPATNPSAAAASPAPPASPPPSQNNNNPPQSQQPQSQAEQTQAAAPSGKAQGTDKPPSQSQTANNPNFTNGPDSDDPNFVGDNMWVTFRFWGQSAELWAIIPSLRPNDATISNTNVSFAVDGNPHPASFTNTPTQPGVEYALKNVFSVDKLEDTNHTLTVLLAPKSVFLVGWLNYSSFATDGVSTTTTTAFGEALTGGSASSSSPISQHNVATFAGAVGGSLGVFTVMALCLWISIWTRRRRSRKRNQQIEEEDAANARRYGLDPEEVSGPIPFVPRYFPGTIPPSPPPYEPAASDDGHNGGSGTATTSSINESSTAGILAPIPRRIPPPETAQLQTTPPVSIAAASIMNRSATTSERRMSILSYGDLPLPSDEPEDILPVTHSPPGLTAAAEERETPIVQSRPSSRHSRRLSRNVERREDEMSDTENGQLLPPNPAQIHLSTTPIIAPADVSYRVIDESPER